MLRDAPTPKSSPRCLLQTPRACPAAVSAQHPLGNPRSGTGQRGGASSTGDMGHHIIAVPFCRLRTRMGDAGPALTPVWQGHPQPGHPLPPAAIPSARTHMEEAPTVPGWSSPLGTLTPPEELRAQGLSRPWLCRCPTAGPISGCPRPQLPPPLARSVPCHLAPVNNSPALSPLFPCRYL